MYVFKMNDFDLKKDASNVWKQKQFEENQKGIPIVIEISKEI